MCVLYVSFGCFAMGSAVLFILSEQSAGCFVWI